jgi:glycerol-3-phosphate dehydrogenase (NAD+)
MSINSELVHRVCVVGAGSWGTAVAKLVAFNCKRHPEFEELVTLWVHDEKIRTFPAFGEMKLLSDVINSTHVNPKYLPGVTLPDTVVAEPDLAKAASQATLVIIAVPHEYLHTAMFSKILSGCAPNCRVCSLVKGLDVINGRPSLVSERIKRDLLGLDVAVLMGANIASEVAASEFCEATLGTNVPEDGPIWQRVFNTDQFRVNVVLDATGVELCGALKPIISLGAGFCDGMDCGARG